MKWSLGCLGMAVVLAGCASYGWRSSVPPEMRTVSVPTFRNESNVTELGAVASRQLLREFQREGTFAIRSTGDSALEIQGVIVKATGNLTGQDRRLGSRINAFDMKLVALVSVIDKRKGRVLVDNRTYKAQVPYAAGMDVVTALRDASGRAAEDLARQVVDDVLNLKWEEKAHE